MPWLCAIIETAEESVEILSDALMEVGALAVDVQDAAAGGDEHGDTEEQAEPAVEFADEAGVHKREKLRVGRRDVGALWP